jgi:hypothetical protein
MTSKSRFDQGFEEELEKISIFGLPGRGGVSPRNVKDIEVKKQGGSFTLVYVMTDGTRREIKNAQNLVSGSMQA